MQEKGLEPSWYCYHTDLNRARLPIPPFLRTKTILHIFALVVNSFYLFFFTILLNLFLSSIFKRFCVF